MNRTLKVYVDVDSLFDYRRALLQYMMTEGIEDPEERVVKGDKLWAAHIERNYKERRFDTFNYPQFSIDEDRFNTIYRQRSVEHWQAGMFYPTRLVKQMIKRIIDIESISDKPLEIKEIKVYVNTFPYEFSEEHLAELEECVRVGLKGLGVVSTFFSNPSDHDAKFYGNYDYVFRYNMVLDESALAFFDSFTANPIPKTSFILPDILARGNDTFSGPPKEWMLAAFLWLGPALKLLPIEHSLYDYDEE